MNEGARFDRLDQREGRLKGRTIFLSASVPSQHRADRYRRIPHAQVEIEHAVVCLARAIFTEGGGLVFGGHPSISPLVSLVAGEYTRHQSVATLYRPGLETNIEKPAFVTIHQLDAFRNEIPRATRIMEELGQARVVWHPTLDSELELHCEDGQPPFPQSLRKMRRSMLSTPTIVGMVCIGGMEGIEEEVDIFLEVQDRLPIYALTSSGGAASMLLEQRGLPSSSRRRIRMIEDEVLGELRPQLRGENGQLEPAPLRYTPYPLIMQVVVEELSQSHR